MSLNEREKSHLQLAMVASGRGKLCQGFVVCDECHGTGLLPLSSMQSPRLCDVCHGKGTIEAHRVRREY